MRSHCHRERPVATCCHWTFECLWIMASLKIPLSGVTSDWSKARCQHTKWQAWGLTPWMGVWIGGLIAKLKLIKAKSKIKYNQNQKKSKCINYVILDSVFGCEFDLLRTVNCFWLWLLVRFWFDVIPKIHLKRLSRVAYRVSRIAHRVWRIAYHFRLHFHYNINKFK